MPNILPYWVANGVPPPTMTAGMVISGASAAAGQPYAWRSVGVLSRLHRTRRRFEPTRGEPSCSASETGIPSIRVAVEVAGAVTIKPYPESQAGRRVVPLPEFAIELLAAHREAFPPGPAGEVFTNTTGGPLRRTLFRARVWRPALVRAGLLACIDRIGHFTYRAAWTDAEGIEWSAGFTTEREAIAHAAKTAAGGLRFHDLRHSYATELVSRGVPVNDVQAVMGHEKPSTTLNLYTHRSDGRDERIRKALADDLLTFGERVSR